MFSFLKGNGVIFLHSIVFVILALAVLSFGSVKAEIVEVPLQEGNLQLPERVGWAIVVPPVTDAEMASVVTKAGFDANPAAMIGVLRRRVAGKPTVVFLGDQQPYDQAKVSGHFFAPSFPGAREAIEKALDYMRERRSSESFNVSNVVFVFPEARANVVYKSLSVDGNLGGQAFQEGRADASLGSSTQKTANPFLGSDGKEPQLRLPKSQGNNDPNLPGARYYHSEDRTFGYLDIVVPFAGAVISEHEVLFQCNYKPSRFVGFDCYVQVQRNPSRVSADFFTNCPCRETLLEMSKLDALLKSTFSDFLQ
ncbi:hypothetical protein [Leisingera sp. ANG-Vp]|uniref:hypothetical protein n=1 Tax=Leisingera sp. ANG-Vp TaxID=1577896 RepID=UPI00126A4FFC|nr:hypothetical protein [Leisingera sp. ANG-Vp]